MYEIYYILFHACRMFVVFENTEINACMLGSVLKLFGYKEFP